MALGPEKVNVLSSQADINKFWCYYKTPEVYYSTWGKIWVNLLQFYFILGSLFLFLFFFFVCR